MKIRYRRLAQTDLDEIWRYNADRYGFDRAARYYDFLIGSIEELVENPDSGKALKNYPGLFRLILKARQRGHGHAVFYRVEKDAITVIRVLHTARNWPQHIFQ